MVKTNLSCCRKIERRIPAFSIPAAGYGPGLLRFYLKKYSKARSARAKGQHGEILYGLRSPKRKLKHDELTWIEY